MKSKNKPNTELILHVMRTLSWLSFVGYAIVAGSILISFIVSLRNPIAAKDLYLGLDYSSILDYGFWYYVAAISFRFTINCLLSYVWFMVWKTLDKMNLKNPFTMTTALKLEKIGLTLFATWILMMVASGYMAWMHKKTGLLYEDWSTSQFIFLSGLIYVISQIFKRGVEIQSENELTV